MGGSQHGQPQPVRRRSSAGAVTLASISTVQTWPGLHRVDRAIRLYRDMHSGHSRNPMPAYAVTAARPVDNRSGFGYRSAVLATARLGQPHNRVPTISPNAHQTRHVARRATNGNPAVLSPVRPTNTRHGAGKRVFRSHTASTSETVSTLSTGDHSATQSRSDTNKHGTVRYADIAAGSTGCFSSTYERYVSEGGHAI